nr:hypothetical protein [Tanacetum cinerariifolium]
MASLADKAILSGAENRPPMLEKDMYDSWRSRMELYMLNRQHGRMILESVKHGPLLWPSVTEDGETRLKKYSKLSAAEATQADCDVKATNTILQSLPPEIYALVSTHKVAKDLWERIQMLMQGTSSSKQKVENSNSEEHLTLIATMTDNRTMDEMLRPPTEGCAEEIIVPPILAEQFELKHSLINMMNSEQFFGLEKDNPHDHIR